MRRGAIDFLPKPFTPAQIRLVLDRVAKLRRLQSHVEELEEQVRSIVPEADLQTRVPAMQQALALAFKAAPTEATILLRGESGTGKGVLARAVHARSPRAFGPFVTVHCPSLSVELLETELFGHVRGRLYRGRAGYGRQGGRRRRGNALSRRNRRPARRASAQAPAAPAGEALRARRRGGNPFVRRADHRRHAITIWKRPSPAALFARICSTAST